MSEEKIECNQTDKILKMICEVEKKYLENFTAQAELFKAIIPKAMNYDNKNDENDLIKNKLITKESFNDPFTFMLDFLGRGDEGRREVAKALMGEKNQDVLYLGVQNLTRVKSSHLNKTIDKDCNNGEEKDIQECLKDIFLNEDNKSLKNLKDNFEELEKLFPTPTSTVTSVLYWLYPEEYIPFDENSKRLYKELGLKEVNKNDWVSYNKVKEALKKELTNIDGLSKDGKKFKPSMIIALSLVAWMNNNPIENILDKFIDSDTNKPKNIILTGIPGTGKTHAVMEYLKNNKDIGGYEFVQFHPSYDYEDFIEGLKPIPSKNGQIEFKLVNGVFKNLCKKAFENEKKTYVMVIDEINRANLSRVFGELLYCLEYRGEFVSTKMTTYIKSFKNEEDKKSYSVDESNDDNIGKFAIPKNVIIIGTMNEVDRSIDAFDLALRRRFIWEEVGFDSSALRVYPKFFEIDAFISNIEDLIKKAENLNKKLAKDIGVNYQLGHTYYFKIADYFDGDFDSALCDLWEYHLKSIVREYCKVKYAEFEIETKLKEYKKRIVDDKKCDG